MLKEVGNLSSLTTLNLCDCISMLIAVWNCTTYVVNRIVSHVVADCLCEGDNWMQLALLLSRLLQWCKMRPSFSVVLSGFITLLRT